MSYFIGITLLLDALYSLNNIFEFIKIPFDFSGAYWVFCSLSFILAIFYTYKENENKGVTFILVLLFSFCVYSGLFIFGWFVLTGLILMFGFVGFIYLLTNLKTFFTKQNIIKALKIILYIILALSLLLNLILLEERQELRKQIPHIAGIGGTLMERPDPIPNPKTEADYINNYCQGFIEYTLPDRTRVDCLYNGYAIEFDFAKKWAESIGQSLYYAKMTGNKPAVAIIMKSPEDERYIKRIEAVDKNITIFRIKAYQQEK